MWQRYNQTTHIFEKSLDNGGSWTPLALAASSITEGTFAKAQLPATVAYTDVANQFTLYQGIQNTDARWHCHPGNSVGSNFSGNYWGSEICHNCYWNGSAYVLNSNPSYAPWILRLGLDDSFRLFRGPVGSVALTEKLRVDQYGQVITAGAIFPGHASGNVIQTSYYLTHDASYGLYSNTGLYLGGGLWVVSTSFLAGVQAAGNIHNTNGYIYPGTPAYQGSWFIAGNSSYGLYINTGLYIEAGFYPASIACRGGLTSNTLESANWIRVAAGFYELGRASPTGSWIGYTPTLVNPSGAWTGSVIASYILVGQTCFVRFAAEATSVNVATTYLKLSLPFAQAGQAIVSSGAAHYYFAGYGYEAGMCEIPPGDPTYVNFYRSFQNGSFPAVQTYVRGEISYQIG